MVARRSRVVSENCLDIQEHIHLCFTIKRNCSTGLYYRQESWSQYMIFYSSQQRKELNIMRKTIPAAFIFVAILFPFVLSSCAHISTPVLVDSDKDGVYDNYDNRNDFTIPQYYDKCSETKTGVKVDNIGCPQDADKDDVPDYLDKCPGTPIGVKVDNIGCPLDTDKDGVPDYLDKCPGTPAGVKLDKDGCPLDSDGDGTPDYLDKCPGTPAGVKVEQ